MLTENETSNRRYCKLRQRFLNRYEDEICSTLEKLIMLIAIQAKAGTALQKKEPSVKRDRRKPKTIIVSKLEPKPIEYDDWGREKRYSK